MNEHEAGIWNAAIDAALKSYPKGVGAIRSLRVRLSVTIDHSEHSEKQEVVNVTDQG